jgi:hypothetical protein
MAQTRPIIGRRRIIAAAVAGCVAVALAVPSLVSWSAETAQAGGGAHSRREVSGGREGFGVGEVSGARDVPEAKRKRLQQALAAHVKAHMHDPESFEALEVSCRRTERGVIARLRFQGADPLGEVVEQTVHATMDPETGEVVTFRSVGQAPGQEQ